VDAASRQVAATWAPAADETISAVAIDPHTHRVFVALGRRLLLLDSRSGELLAERSAGGRIGSLAFDAGTRLLIWDWTRSDGTLGELTVARSDAEGIHELQRVLTPRGAGGFILDPRTHAFYLMATAPPSWSSHRVPGAFAFHLLVFEYRST
jgi:hypothetical protein